MSRPPGATAGHDPPALRACQHERASHFSAPPASSTLLPHARASTSAHHAVVPRPAAPTLPPCARASANAPSRRAVACYVRT